MRRRRNSTRYFGGEQIDRRLRNGLLIHSVGIGSGLVIQDFSGYNYDQNLNGTEWQWSLGREQRDHAVDFTGGVGSLSYASTRDTVTGEPLSAVGSSVSLSVWVYSHGDLGGANAQSFCNKLVSNSTHVTPFYAYALLALASGGGTSNALRFAITTGGAVTFLTGAAGSMTYKEWIHVVGTYDGATMRLYKNGVEIASTAKTGTVNEYNASFRVGSNGSLSLPLFGRLNDMRVYNRTLSTAEISILSDPRYSPVTSVSRRTLAGDSQDGNFFFAGY